MHELSIMSNILDIVLDYAGRGGARRVVRINLEVGQISDLIPEWMQTYFDAPVLPGEAEKAELSVERVPAVLRCKSCGAEFGFTREDWRFSCASCGSADISIVSGREFRIVSIEVE